MGVGAVMFARTNEKLSDDQIRRLAFELKEGFGGAIWRQKGSDYGLGLRRAKPADPSDEDAESNYGVPAAETLLRVNLWSRYYGPGYERGDPPTLIAIAQWLEAKIPGAEVWYGGDSGDTIERFDAMARQALWTHFLANGHRPYVNGFGNLGREAAAAPICDFCREPTTACMWGGGRTGYRCDGCEGHWVVTAATGVVSECGSDFEPKAAP